MTSGTTTTPRERTRDEKIRRLIAYELVELMDLDPGGDGQTEEAWLAARLSQPFTVNVHLGGEGHAMWTRIDGYELSASGREWVRALIARIRRGEDQDDD